MTSSQLDKCVRAGYTRRTLIHITPVLYLGSCTVFMWELLLHLPEYHHIVLYTSPITEIETTLMWALQATGADVLQVDEERIQEYTKHHTAAIVYDSCGYMDMDIPTIRYAYHNYTSDCGADVTIVPSEYAKRTMTPAMASNTVVIPPGIRSRSMRNLRKRRPKQPFSISILTSGEHSKRPDKLIQWLIQHKPEDVRLIISHNDTIPADVKDRTVWKVPIMLDAAIKGIQLSDIGIYAHSADYVTPYGKLLWEMLASGMPVICERRGAITDELINMQHLLYFETPEQILEHIQYLRTYKREAETLSANGQLIASWQDITIHIGSIKKVLRMLGA